MTRKREQRIRRLFAAALDRPRDKRQAFLLEACSGDARTLAELEALLDAHERDPAFLKHPWFEGVDVLLGSEGAPPPQARPLRPPVHQSATGAAG